MSWTFIIAFAAGAFLIRLSGLVVPADRLPTWFTDTARVLPPAIIMAIIAVQTFGGPDRTLLLDSRIVGVGVALILALVRAPLGLLILASLAATAASRALLGLP